MPRSKGANQLTPLELKIMKVLWDEGPSTVQAVQTALTDRKLAYTTVQTMLNVLVRKGKASRVRVERAYRYRAAISREKAARNTVRDIVERLFGGSPEALVMSLVETKELTPETLRRLQRIAEEKE